MQLRMAIIFCCIVHGLVGIKAVLAMETRQFPCASPKGVSLLTEELKDFSNTLLQDTTPCSSHLESLQKRDSTQLLRRPLSHIWQDCAYKLSPEQDWPAYYYDMCEGVIVPACMPKDSLPLQQMAQVPKKDDQNIFYRPGVLPTVQDLTKVFDSRILLTLSGKILDKIFQYLKPQDCLAYAQTCKAINECVQPLFTKMRIFGSGTQLKCIKKSLLDLWSHSDKVTALYLSHDGSTLVMGSSSGLLTMFKGIAGGKKRSYDQHTDRINALTGTSCGNVIFSCSDDCTIGRCDRIQDKWTLFSTVTPALSLALIENQGLLLSGHEKDSRIAVRDAREGSIIRYITLPIYGVVKSINNISLDQSKSHVLVLWGDRFDRCNNAEFFKNERHASKLLIGSINGLVDGVPGSWRLVSENAGADCSLYCNDLYLYEVRGNLVPMGKSFSQNKSLYERVLKLGYQGVDKKFWSGKDLGKEGWLCQMMNDGRGGVVVARRSSADSLILWWRFAPESPTGFVERVTSFSGTIRALALGSDNLTIVLGFEWNGKPGAEIWTWK